MDALRGASWTVLGTAPGAIAGPQELEAAAGEWIPAEVPGTVAGAIRSARGLEAALATDIDGQDWWWRSRIAGTGAHLLLAEGLATVADVWIDGAHVLRGQNMFRRFLGQPVELSRSSEIVLRFAAPLVGLSRSPRPRWKTALVTDQRWRLLRTTMLGRVPTWAGTAAPAGPWRPLRLLSLAGPVIAAQRIATRVEDRGGVIDVELDVHGEVGSARVRCADAETSLRRDPDGRLRGSLYLPRVQRWWPHTHGDQPLYEVVVSLDGGEPIMLARTGFRTVVGGDDDGLSLIVNGVPVFARGACWNNLDVISLQADDQELRRALTQARDGGHNIVRLQGSWTYESDQFYSLCDELGILVWQDCMLATLDLPSTEEFTADLSAEVGDLADRLAARACVAVVCGGAETEQQPAMLGQHGQDLRAITETIPRIVAERLPGVVFVRSTPTGGPLPIHASIGVAQYFGVGAYLAPLADVRGASVRFAAESLAFSIPPETDGLLRGFGSARVAGHDPRWKATVPRDVTAAWDFEDVRDHYVRQIFGVDPMLVRYADPERYLDLGRAAVCIAMTEVMTWWRRPASQCSGGIVLSMRDQVLGAGWGLRDAHGRAKAPWFALKEVLAPLALLVSDDGADGVTITAVNDRPTAIAAVLEARTWSEHGALVDEGTLELDLPGHSARDISLDTVLGRFSDAGFYYRFGPRQRDLIGVRLRTGSGEVLAERTAQLGNHLRSATGARPAAAVRAEPDGWVLEVSAEHPTYWVAIDSATHEPDASWFHLAPGQRRRIALTPLPGVSGEPRVSVRAFGHAEATVAIAGPPADSTTTGSPAADGAGR